jgi:triacylglycerol esterase/lipase EstA (alpha/beta hydrolase family)
VLDTNFGLDAIDTLIPSFFLYFQSLTNYPGYYHSIIELFKSNGYQPGYSLWGYPYDWRQSPSLDRIQLPLLKRIEEAYHACGNQKITVITHSMGGVVFRCFMQLHPDAVKRYVRRWVAIAAPFNGAAGVLKAFVWGHAFSMPTFIAPQHMFHYIEVPLHLFLISLYLLL